jgi:hypothetical protein
MAAVSGSPHFSYSLWPAPARRVGFRDIAKMNNDANKLQASDDDYSHLNSLD